MSTAFNFDVRQFAMAPDAPPEKSCVRLELHESGRLVHLILDPPHRKQAVFDGPLMRDLFLRLQEVQSLDGVEGLVLTGRDPLSFCYGADLDAVNTLETAHQAEKLGAAGQYVFHTLYRMGKSGGGKLRTVAAVGGPVPGGAYEVSLACDIIVAAEHKTTKIGLPEVKLGIVPGWGGCQRLPRRVGVANALRPVLTGSLFDPKRAKRMGLIDRVTWPTYLLRVAGNLALGREKFTRRERGWKAWALDKNPLWTTFVGNQAKKGVLKQTHGHYPAPLEAVDLICAAPRRSLEEGLAAEARALGPLATSPVCRSLVSIFHASEDAKKRGQLEDGSKPAKFSRAAVIGGGVMGGGIASALAQKGTPTRLRDLSQGALDDAIREHHSAVLKKKKRRRLKANEADAAIDRLETTTSGEGFGACDFVIEAVSEVLEVKHKVLRDIAGRVRPDAVIASNTSSLSIDAIAAALPSPERVVGMHFFNPVAKMPLVEVVRGQRTAPEVVARTAALALALGKTPVVTKDAPGFVVNRLLGPYLDECCRLFELGSTPYELDRIALEFGMPMGPMVLLDEVGLDIAAHTAQSLWSAFGARMEPSRLLQPLVESGQLGKKAGKGVYLHRGKKKSSKPALNPSLKRPAGARAVSPLSHEEITDRMVLPMVNEAARLFSEGVVDTPQELDLATVFGMGFAPFRGGVLAYADSLGAAEVQRRLEHIANQTDVLNRGDGAQRFQPAEWIIDLAKSGGKFRG